ncbi:quinoprotein glucose dehydrogenase [Thalassospira xiamenensis M-5 = DSM 17429]|uniref:Glucose dehydrogenase n=1 Tax=Thalassospira xiamenensis M-5 = DSM 17429 TaxID=1123366 RepID=A0AB72UEJ9_9PROT|nr:glucose/quinate/shikimate family membrane-bound PQQ-dependent dehydrogenase [Thalassospira xiamenensis]AJD52602.1 Glucose dehydrogenase [Thalassospira xiamenensis M-5 = DSM 17429]SIT23273.1 quinoprotein glucose dehydrogenase [Thalassospira xiamenensis M-5 = DSM 17429]
MINILTSGLLALIGLALGAGGVWLIFLDGSWYYAFAGLAFLIAAALSFAKRPVVLPFYALFMIASLGWAVWEVGFDWWQLGPRGGLIVLIGLWLAMPAYRKTLLVGQPVPEVKPTRSFVLEGSLVLAIVVAVYSMMNNPHAIEGQLNDSPVVSSPDLGGDVPAGDWHQYGRTPFGQRYSPLDQINTDNVATLEQAWVFQTGDVRRSEDVPETTYQVTPLKINDTLYLCTPHSWAMAIDAKTGQEKWRFDPEVPDNTDRQHQTCRGVTFYQDTTMSADASCAARVYLPTSDARLIALDANNGEICADFGDQGTVHLEEGMPYNPAGYYYSTSPPVVADGKIIIGGAVNDNYSTKSQSGVIRAYDVNSGELVWNWDSGNPEQTEPIPEGQTYTANSPNSWSVSSVDEELGMIYVPLGNKVPDQLGMGRSEEVETYSSSIVALSLETGQVQWVRQTVHHDLWDMDVPAQPALLDITTSDGENVPALVGPTKQGDIYVLDRRTGEPIIPVREVPAPGGAIPEDFIAPTQPVSDLTFMPEPLTEKDMWGITLFDQLACRIQFHQLKYEGRYTPPSLEGTLVYPGNFGTFNWGSVAIDPEKQIMFGMPTYLAFTSQLIPRDEVPPRGTEKASEMGINRNEGAPYAVNMGPFLSPVGVPCQAPPWGYVAGADLRTGEVVYKHKNGTVEDMTPLPLPFELGVPGIGGPIITKGGVAFLGAGVDNYFRAYDVTTGKQLWEARLPAGGQSTPMTYTTDDGTQYVLIVAGGHGSIGTKAGDYVVAYKLP